MQGGQLQDFLTDSFLQSCEPHSPGGMARLARPDPRRGLLWLPPREEQRGRKADGKAVDPKQAVKSGAPDQTRCLTVPAVTFRLGCLHGGLEFHPD